MSETLENKLEQINHDDSSSHLSIETVFHGTSVQAAKRILEEGFKPAPHASRPDLGPVSWFSTEDQLASGYGLETRVRDANGVLTVLPNGGPTLQPSYGVVIEAEAPKSSDPRGFNTTENGIEYIGTTRLVTELGMGNVAIKAMRLYEHRPTADGTLSTSGRLIDEYIYESNQSALTHIRNKIRRKKNTMLGRPTL